MAIVRDAEPRVCLPICEVAWKLALFWDVLLVAVHCALLKRFPERFRLAGKPN